MLILTPAPEGGGGVLTGHHDGKCDTNIMLMLFTSI